MQCKTAALLLLHCRVWQKEPASFLDGCHLMLPAAMHVSLAAAAVRKRCLAAALLSLLLQVSALL